jgi:TonB-dependent receptor
MNSSARSARFVLCATTALTFFSGLAHAQTSTATTTTPQALNLGSVVATGTQSGTTGSTAPSATGSLKQAQELKKLAPNVISVLPQSEIEHNPDVNIADAFTRLPGVSLVSDSGEGQFIDIRGLDADLNATTFDNIHLTANDQGSPSGNERAPDLGAFPAGIVGGVQVTKSLTPDMDAEGLGGSANIAPISLPANGGPMLNVTLAAGEETLRPTGIFQGNIQAGGSFAIPGMRSFANAKPFSALFAYSYYSDRRGIDDVEESYDSATETGGGNNADLDNLQMRYYQEHRVRQGLYGELQFNPSPITGFFFRVLKSGFTNQIDKDRLEFSAIDAPNATGPDGAIGSDGNFTDLSGVKPTARYTYDKYTVESDVLELGGHTTFNNFLSVNGTASYTEGSNVEPIDYVTEFTGKKINGFNYSVLNTEYRYFSINSGLNTANPANYSLPSGDLTNNPQYAFDQEWAAALNASFANNILGSVGEAKFGAQVRLRSEGDLQYNYANPNAGPNLATLTGGASPIVYYNSRYSLAPFPNYGLLFGSTPLVGATSNPNDPNDPTGLAYADYQANIGSFQHNSENVYAAYGQETVEFGKVELLAGLRMEDTNGSYGAYAGTDTNTVSTVNGDEIFSYAFNKNKQDYINLFPSAQFKYSFSSQFQMRATYSTGIARPGFQQISAATSTVAGGAPNGDNAVTVGNPSLKPTTGNSFDVTAEYYGPHETTFSGGVFYKLFDNYIFQTINYGNLYYQGALTPTQITSYANESGAFAEGLELEAHQRLYFLPAPIDGLGIDGNITFVNSRGHSDGPDFKAYQLPETSPLTYNASLFYEKGPLFLQGSVTYTSRSLFAVVNPAASGLTDLNPRDADNFTSARATVDVDADYAITPRVTVFAQGRNLTNTPLEFTQSPSAQYPIQREFYDADFLAGIRLKLAN